MAVLRASGRQIWIIVLVVLVSSTTWAGLVCADLFGAEKPVQSEDLERMILHTERLVLKPVTTLQVNEAVEVWADPENVRMSGDNLNKYNISTMLSNGSVRYNDVKFSPHPYVNFGMYEDGHLVGLSQVGVDPGKVIYKSGVGQKYQKWLVMSYHLRPTVWGKGLASEAAFRILRFAFENLYANGMHLIILPDNFLSQRVAQKLGFVRIQKKTKDKYLHFYMTREMYFEKYSEFYKKAG